MLDLEKKDRIVRELSELTELELQSVIDELKPILMKNKTIHIISDQSRIDELEEEVEDLKGEIVGLEEKLEDIRMIL